MFLLFVQDGDAMRSKHKAEDAEQKKTVRFLKPGRFFAVIYGLFTLGLIGVILFSGILPILYVFVAIIIILFLSILVLPPLIFRVFKSSRRILAIFFALILSICYAFAIFYFVSTLNFFANLTSVSFKTDTYDVVVRDDDKYNSIRDIENKKVYAIDGGETYEKAKEKLKSKVDVKIKDSANAEKNIKDLLDGEKEVVYLKDDVYKDICSRKKSYSDYSKIIKRFIVRVKLKDNASHTNVTKNSFNVYVTGIDTSGNINTQSRSDVNMLLTVNPRAKKILVTSIPRDYYVDFPGTGAKDKLTHAGLDGADYTVKTFERFSGLKVNYYMKVNFSTVKELINSMDGVDVKSDYSFYAEPYKYKKGINHMNGDKALTFARERHAFEKGDLQRNINQERVFAAIVKKMTSSKTLLLNYTDLLRAIDGMLDTNMSSGEMRALVKMQLGDMASWKVSQQSMVGDVDMMYSYNLGDNASVVIPDMKSVEKAKKKIKNFKVEK